MTVRLRSVLLTGNTLAQERLARPAISETLVLPENERGLEKMDECPVHNTHVDGRNSCVACEETGFLFEAKLGNISQIGVVGD